MNRLPPLLALLGLLGAGCAVAAGDLEPPDLARYYRWGPLRARPGLQVWRVGYDNNIFLDDSNKVGDYTATVSPKLEGLMLFGDRAFFDFRARLDYRVYVQNPDQNYLDHLGRGRLTVPLNSSFGVFTDYVMDYVHQRPQDLEDIRPLRKDRRLGFGAILELGWRTDLEVSQRYVDITYKDDDNPEIAVRLDREELRRAVGLKYLLKGRTRATLDLETRDIEFDFNGGFKDSEQWLAAAGLIFGEGGPLTGSFRLGWSEIDATNPDRPDFNGLIGDLEMVYRWSSGTRLEFTGESEPAFAVIRDQTYYRFAGVNVRGVHFLTRLFGVETGLGYGELNFPETQADGTDLIDVLTEFDVGVRVRFPQDSMGGATEYSLRIGGSRRDSTDPTRDRTRATVYLGTSFGF